MDTTPNASSGDSANLPGKVYTIETVEQITRITRDQIVLYHRWGLITTSVAAPSEDELMFDDDAIHKLRRIAFLLTEYELNPTGLRRLSELIEEVERLREEVRFLRAK